MKIVRAMKQIKRLQGEVKELQKRASHCLNTIEGNEFEENFESIIKDLTEKKARLSELKNGVMLANVKGDMFKKILQLGELKSHIDFLRELNPQKGISDSGYRSENTKYVTQWSTAEKNAAVQRTQQKINDITDELDDFNARTDIVL